MGAIFGAKKEGQEGRRLEFRQSWVVVNGKTRVFVLNAKRMKLINALEFVAQQPA